MYGLLALLAVFVLVYSLVAGRVERTWVSDAMVFAAFGALVGPLGLGMLGVAPTAEALRGLAELTLALVLFTDAAGVSLKTLKRLHALPLRLLVVGLPLTILLGFAVARLLLPDLSMVEAALLATMLAPTDAALGKPVILNPAVPAPVREGLNVESGLNDGVCVPVLLLFLTLASEQGQGGSAIWLAVRLFGANIGIGAGVGVGLALGASALLRVCARRKWVTESWKPVPVVALAFACFGVAQWMGGSGFIASFVGGLVFGSSLKSHRDEFLQAAEGTGNALGALTWVLFGAAVVDSVLLEATWTALLYAALSLTVIRMAPVFVSLLGMKVSVEERLFVGWFGPRGLASVVFGVMVLDADLPHGREVVLVVVCAIGLSVLLHGATANAWARAFGRRSGASGGR